MAKQPKKNDVKSNGEFRTSFAITMEQAEELKAEAIRRQRERVRRGEPAGKADVSEVVRDILRVWVPRNRPRQPKAEQVFTKDGRPAGVVYRDPNGKLSYEEGVLA